MLTDLFPKLKNSRFVELIHKFFRSPFYIAIVVALMACAELFGVELPVYYTYLALIVILFLFDEDLLGAVAIASVCYMTIATKHNPGKFTDTPFSNPAWLVQVLYIGIVGVCLLVIRLISLAAQKRAGKLPALTIGYILLGIAYLVGGAFSKYYENRSTLYGFVQILALSFTYFIFVSSINWKRAPKDYCMTLCFAIGVGIAAEIVAMYFLPGAIQSDGIHRYNMFTGWGVYNNVGCIAAMCMPAPFYFAATKKHGWIFTACGILLFFSVVLSQSRGSIVCGAVIFFVCLICVLVMSRLGERWKHGVVIAVFAAGLVAAFFIFRSQAEKLFKSLSSVGLSDSNRFKIYKGCWEQFLKAPWFGSGFYHTPGAVMTTESANGMITIYDGEAVVTGFIPPRAHNTLFQLLASGGVFMTLAYLVHRVQTGVLLFRKPTKLKTFIALCILSLLLTSLLDANFFNIGPGFLYGALLLSAEGENRQRGVPPLKIGKKKVKQN